MAYNVADIQTLITNGKVVSITEILTTNAYVSIGYWQKGQRKANSGSNAYPQYAINLQQLLLAAPGTPIIIRDEGGVVSNNVLSIDFQGAGVTVTPDPLDPNPLNPSQVIVNIPGGGGGGGTVTSVNANSGLTVGGTLASPVVQLGTNPLLADTVIPTNTSGFNLSLTGTGKFGVGLTMPTGLGPSAKTQIRGNGSSISRITGDVTGNVLTVTNCATCTPPLGITPISGPLTVGDYIFFAGPNLVPYAIGAYITAQTSPNTYTLSSAPGNRTASGNQNNGAVPPVVIGNYAYFSTSQSLLRLETLGGVRALETWDNGTVKIAGVGGAGTTIWNDGNSVSIGYAAPPNVSNTNLVVPSMFTESINLGGLTVGGSIYWSSSGFSSISSVLGTYDMNYASFGKGHRFSGKAAMASFWDNYQFPSVFGGSQSSAGYGARVGYQLSIYQPFGGTVNYSLSGYVDATAGKLYIYGCTATGLIPAGYLQVGHTLSCMTTYTTGIPEGTAISTIVTAWDPGTTDPITGLCPGTQIPGVYDLETNGGPYSGPNIGSISDLKTIYFSAYPAWNNTRAMYVDGTITFKNLPQSSTGVPAYLSSGDMWVDTSLAGDYALKIKP